MRATTPRYSVVAFDYRRSNYQAALRRDNRKCTTADFVPSATLRRPNERECSHAVTQEESTSGSADVSRLAVTHLTRYDAYESAINPRR